MTDEELASIELPEGTIRIVGMKVTLDDLSDYTIVCAVVDPTSPTIPIVSFKRVGFNVSEDYKQTYVYLEERVKIKNRVLGR